MAVASIFLFEASVEATLQIEQWFELGVKYQSAAQEEEDTNARIDWFVFKRVYPSGSIPQNARLNAWKSISWSIKPGAKPLWQSIGPTPLMERKALTAGRVCASGRINAIAVSPVNEKLVIVGSAAGGIWRSVNAGERFVPVSDKNIDLSVGSIAFYRKDPRIVYAGMGDPMFNYLGHGVLKSTDAGLTWTRINNDSLPSPCTVSKIEVDPENSNRVYIAQHSVVGSNDRAGFYLSTDGGKAWKRTLAGEVCDLQVHPRNSKTIYTAIESGDQPDSPSGVFLSTDSGVTWQPVLQLTSVNGPITFDKSNLYLRIAVTPDRPQMVYAFALGTINNVLNSRLFTSTDGGKLWTTQVVDRIDAVQPWWNLYLAADPTDAKTIYIGALDIHKSTDGGTTWENLTKNFKVEGVLSNGKYTFDRSLLHIDQHAVAFLPRSSKTIYVANDGGLFKSTDGGVSYRPLNYTLSITQFYSLANRPGYDRALFGGTQDNGTTVQGATASSSYNSDRYNSGRYNWERILGGDGGQCVVCPTNPEKVFATQAGGPLYLLGSSDQSTSIAVHNFDVERIAFVYPLRAAGKQGTLYVGTYRLWVSKVGCDSSNLSDRSNWFTPGGEQDLTKGVNAQGKDKLSVIAISPSDTNVIYTGSVQGRAMITTDGGATWKDITSGLPNRFISSITVDPSEATTAIVTVNGYGSGHIFKTRDRGATWEDISGNLPDIPVNALLIDPSNRKTIYIGTDIGLFRSKAQGRAWEYFNQGMPWVIVKAFAVTRGGDILAATFGRGVYALRRSRKSGRPRSRRQ
jgi:photosystem II stability/assembly factor-like uncharacterized protein